MSVVYIHIGSPKTGTTSLQAFLGENRKELKKNGIDYPDGSEFLMLPAYSRHHNGIWIRQCHGKPEYEQMLASLLARCARSDTILFSDEEIFRGYQQDPGIIRDLHHALRAAGHELRVIVYLRRQDEYLTSLWAQKVKRFYTGTFEQWLADINEHVDNGDYYSVLTSLATEVGHDALTVRLYEKRRFTESHTIYADFLEILGIRDITSFTVPAEPKNLSLQDVYLETKRRMNADPFFHVTTNISQDDLRYEAAQAIKDTLVELQEEARAEHRLQNRSLITAQTRCGLLAQYAESNDRLGQEFFGLSAGEPLFTPFDPSAVDAEVIGEEEIYEVLTAALRGQAMKYAQAQGRYDMLRKQTRLKNLPSYTVGKIRDKIRGKK